MNDNNIEKQLERLIEKGLSFIYLMEYYSPGSVPEGYSAKGYYSFDTPEEYRSYKDWLAECSFWSSINYKSRHTQIEGIVQQLFNNLDMEDHTKLLSILKSMQKYPESKQDETTKTQKEEAQGGNVFNINNIQNQSQTQWQERIKDIFLQHVEYELTSSEQKEIKAILEEYKGDLEKAKPKLLEKLMGFGGNVLASVVANILTLT